MPDTDQQISEAEYEANKNSWQYRCVQATHGGQSQLGAILCAVLRTRWGRPLSFNYSATVTSDGFVMCDFVDRHGTMRMGAFVCSVRELIENFRGLADHCKLDDKDRTELFKELRAWIYTDYRAKSGVKTLVEL
jgi:hypothetical protein